MLMQTFEAVLALFALCGLHVSLLTPSALAQGFGSLLGVFVGIALPLGMALTAHKQLEKL